MVFSSDDEDLSDREPKKRTDVASQSDNDDDDDDDDLVSLQVQLGPAFSPLKNSRPPEPTILAGNDPLLAFVANLLPLFAGLTL